jgi:NADH dehydrogenase
MSAKQILVLGGGFAGLWSALGAARKLDELGCGPAVDVTLVNRDAFHSIRVRNYEADLSSARIPLDDVLGPVGIRRVEAEVAGIDPAGQTVTVTTPGGQQRLAYDRLIFALGSQLLRPTIPGLHEYGFDVDTYDAAARLNAHLHALAQRPESPGRFTVVVVGAGLTGIEVATAMTEKLRAALVRANASRPFRVILADHRQRVGSDMGESAQPIIEEALAALGVETRLGIEVLSISPGGITFRSGERVPADTVVWCAGMQANPLTRQFPLAHDRIGRLPVDEFMRVRGAANVLAAGDGAWATMDDVHASVMSCQHSRPMGRFAGHNVVCDLFGQPMLSLRLAWYVTVLDLGPWGAVYTEGWDRRVVAKGEAAKNTKKMINCRRIYPPLNRNRQDILAAAAPVVQQPPNVHH